MPGPLDYDAIADDYDRRYTSWSYAGLRGMLRRVVPADARVLEVGCGTGRWLEELESRGGRVAGLDPSAEMLARARRRRLAASLVRGRAERLPWPDGAFDRVVVVNALHHFTDRCAFLDEARRVLAPGGRVALFGLIPVADPADWFVHRYWPETVELDLGRYPAPDDLVDELCVRGFESVETTVAETIDETIDAERARRSGCLERTSTSQLAMISDAAFEAGAARARAALERGESLRVRIGIHGTTARTGGICDTPARG